MKKFFRSAALLTALASACAALVAPGSSFAAEVRILSDVSQGINAHLRLFSGTGKEIYGSVFEFHNDQAGMMRLALMRDAARRGNKVYLVVDGWGSQLAREMIQYLESEGVEIREFNAPNILKPSTFFYRNHEKIWTDGMNLVMGDSNEGSPYWGPSRGAVKPFKGLNLSIQGAVASTARDHVRALFRSKYVSAPRGKVSNEELSEAKARIDRAEHQLAKLKVIPDSEWESRVRKVNDNDIRFVHDLPDFKGKKGAMGVDTAVLKMIEDARPGEHVVICAPYLVLPVKYKVAIAKKIREGVSIELVTNSFERADKLLAHFGYFLDRDFLLGMGVKLREYHGSEMMHAKGGAVYHTIKNPDGSMHVYVREAYTGSFQPHMRGVQYDLEDILVTKDGAFAKQLFDEFQTNVANSREVLPTYRKVGKHMRCLSKQLMSLLISVTLRPHL